MNKRYYKIISDKYYKYFIYEDGFCIRHYTNHSDYKFYERYRNYLFGIRLSYSYYKENEMIRYDKITEISKPFIPYDLEYKITTYCYNKYSTFIYITHVLHYNNDLNIIKLINNKYFGFQLRKNVKLHNY